MWPFILSYLASLQQPKSSNLLYDVRAIELIILLTHAKYFKIIVVEDIPLSYLEGNIRLYATYERAIGTLQKLVQFL